MDRREQKRLEDEINRGVRNVGIYKVDGDALEKENRSPIFKGAGIGIGLSGPLGIGYLQTTPFWRSSPLGLFPDDYVLVALGIIAAGPVIGAAIGWQASKDEQKDQEPPKDTP